MEATNHYVKHSYQTTNNNCSQTALSILLSHFRDATSAEEITQAVPVNADENGDPWGSIAQQLATWCVSRGYSVVMYTFDCQVIDMSWRTLGSQKLLDRIDAAMAARDVPSLGATWSKLYLQSYANFVRAGGSLHIEPFVSSKLLSSLLKNGPIMTSVCFNTMYGIGRTKETGLRQISEDDVGGKIFNHSIVIHGITDEGDFIIADPWQQPGRHVVNPERLICAITAAQIECDNLLFQLAR
jgi:hypothetical protein